MEAILDQLFDTYAKVEPKKLEKYKRYYGLEFYSKHGWLMEPVDFIFEQFLTFIKEELTSEIILNEISHVKYLVETNEEENKKERISILNLLLDTIYQIANDDSMFRKEKYQEGKSYNYCFKENEKLYFGKLLANRVFDLNNGYIVKVVNDCVDNEMSNMELIMKHGIPFPEIIRGYHVYNSEILIMKKCDSIFNHREEKEKIVKDILHSLSILHTFGCHSDIKPDNIMWLDGNAYLIDYGGLTYNRNRESSKQFYRHCLTEGWSSQGIKDVFMTYKNDLLELIYTLYAIFYDENIRYGDILPSSWMQLLTYINYCEEEYSPLVYKDLESMLLNRL